MIENNTKDSELIEQYLSGDKSVLVTLVERWHKIFCEKANWILHDKDLSRDVAQDSWIVIINKINTLKNTNSFKSWALRIVYSKSIDAYKLRSKRLNDLNLVASEKTHPIQEEEDNTELKIKLLKCIQNLTKEKQDVIRLFYVEEYSLNEISKFLGIPIGTTKSRLFKAREEIKNELK